MGSREAPAAVSAPAGVMLECLCGWCCAVGVMKRSGVDQRPWSRLMIILVAVAASFGPLRSQARSPHRTRPPESAASAPAEDNLLEHGRYVNRDGVPVHVPAHTRDGRPPAGASAQCRDGSYSFSRHHRGTCSGHHGVAQWLP